MYMSYSSYCNVFAYTPTAYYLAPRAGKRPRAQGAPVSASCRHFVGPWFCWASSWPWEPWWWGTYYRLMGFNGNGWRWMMEIEFWDFVRFAVWWMAHELRAVTFWPIIGEFLALQSSTWICSKHFFFLIFDLRNRIMFFAFGFLACYEGLYPGRRDADWRPALDLGTRLGHEGSLTIFSGRIWGAPKCHEYVTDFVGKFHAVLRLHGKPR